MSETSTLIGYQGRAIDREALALVPTPLATKKHNDIPHHQMVTALVETLGFRHIGVVRDEYAVSPDGMKMFRWARSGDRDARLPFLDWGPKFARQEHAARDDVWLSRAGLQQHGL